MIPFQYFKMMVGLPGSGKSTAVKKELALNEDLVVVSTDDIREEINGNASDQSNGDRVFFIAKTRIVDALNSGKSVIFDATNVVSKKRVGFINNIIKSAHTGFSLIAHVMCTPVETCLEYNKARQNSGGRFVPEEVIDRMLRSFQVPQYFEGFDYIYFDDSSACSSPTHEDLYGLMCKVVGYNFDQNTPHHKYDLLTHCIKVSESFDKKDVRFYAGIVHDFGKVFTRTTDESGVSHYYNHENVGAYKLLSNLNCFRINDTHIYTDSVLDILFFVNYHMHIRDVIKSSKAIERYKNLWGEERFNKLVEFMEADNKASGREDL